MKNKFLLFILIFILPISLIACNDDESSTKGTAIKNDEISNKIAKNNTEELNLDTENQNEGELVFIQSVDTYSSFSNYNEEKVERAMELGYESPKELLDIYRYTPKSSDVLQFTSQDSSFELGESLVHSGFHSLEVVYKKYQYMCDEFFGDLDVTEYSREITVSLKGESIYEADIVDDYEKYYRYYDENKGLYYEVQDLMMGNFTDPNAELTNKKIGMVCNYASIDGIEAPTYNPLILENDEEGLNYYITSFDDKPCVYIETLFNEKVYKKWVDIQYGVVVKELVFDSEGLLIEKSVAVSIVDKDYEDSIFFEPKDIEYKDITMFIFMAEGGPVDTLYDAVYNTIPNDRTGIKLIGNNDSTITFYTKGIYEGMVGDLELDDVFYISYHTNSSGETSRIREIKDDRYYTIHDGMDIVEIFDESCYEKKFFNFSEVGLLNVEVSNDTKYYTFYDPNNISVSGLYNVYEYVIEDNKFASINCYEIESITDNEPVRDIVTYTIEMIPFDESVYDESCLDTYKIIDHGEGSFNDGEYMPFWYE